MKGIDKFLLKTGLLISGVALLSFSLYIAAVHTRFDNNDHYLFAMTAKHKRAADIKTPKILFIGGSNLPFGLDSEKIQNDLGMPVVNFGLHAGLGLKFMFEEAKPFIHKDDIIVVVPEYHQFFGDACYGEETLVNVLVNIYPEGESLINITHRFKLLKFYPKIIRAKLISKILKPKKDEIYLSSSFNEFGDVVAHIGKAPKGFHPQLLEDNKINYDAIKSLRMFNDFIQSQGAVLYFCYPAYYRESYNSGRPSIEMLDKILSSETDVKIICKPDEFVFNDKKYFFDGAYHLSRTGIEERTSRLINLLRNYFNQEQHPYVKLSK